MDEEAGGAMRFVGKVDVWFYLIAIAANILLVVPAAMALADPAKEGSLIGVVVSLGCLAVCDALFIPMIVRNYVEFDDEGNFVVVPSGVIGRKVCLLANHNQLCMVRLNEGHSTGQLCPIGR